MGPFGQSLLRFKHCEKVEMDNLLPSSVSERYCLFFAKVISNTVPAKFSVTAIQQQMINKLLGFLI